MDGEKISLAVFFLAWVIIGTVDAYRQWRESDNQSKLGWPDKVAILVTGIMLGPGLLLTRGIAWLEDRIDELLPPSEQHAPPAVKAEKKIEKVRESFKNGLG